MSTLQYELEEGFVMPKTEGTVIREYFKKTPLKDIMTSPVIKISEDDELSLAQVKFKNHRISHLVIVNKHNKFSGVLSQKYLYKARSPRKILQDGIASQEGVIIDGDSFFEKETLDSYILKHLMNKETLTLSPEDNILDAVKLMTEKNVSFIPVVNEENNVEGSVSGSDIINFLSAVVTG